MIFHLPGAGNSKWIAEQIARVQNGTFVFMPDATRDGIKEFVLADNEKVGFIFPIYSWGPPLAVPQFLDRVTLTNRHSQYIYLVCSCGGDTGLAGEAFCGVLSHKRIGYSAGLSVTMPNSYVLLPGFNVDKKGLEEEKLEKIVGRVEEVSCSISIRKTGFHYNGGSSPWLKAKMLNPLFNCFMTSAKPSCVVNDCTGCKRCERVCPVGNVVMIRWRPVWGVDCTSRLACYHVRPKYAVQYGKRTGSKGQYLDPNVSALHESAKQRVL